MFSMMQLYRSAARYLDNTRQAMSVNRKACLVFNQIERDFSTAFIPDAHTEIKPKKEAGEAENPDKKEADGASETHPEVDPSESKEEKEKKAKEKAEKRKTYFVAEIDDRVDPEKVDRKKYDLLKRSTFICTNPLQVFGQQRSRFVRVLYELVRDKTKSTRDVACYNLWRRECEDLSNVKMKEDEFAAPSEKKAAIRSHLVSDNVKFLSIEYVLQEKKKTQEGEKGEIIEKRSFTWGDKKENQGIVPKFIEIRIVFWSDALNKDYVFQAMFPIISFPTLIEKEDKKSSENKQMPDAGKDAATQPGLTPGPESPPVTVPPVMPPELG